MRRFPAPLFFVLVVFGAFYFLPWRNMIYPSTVMVVGNSKSNEKTTIASFSASVTAYNDDKNKAVAEVNEKMTKLIDEVKAFGVSGDDVKTQVVGVSEQPEIMIYPRPVASGKWQATNSVEIILRDVEKASGLTDLLNKSGATNVYGPNFKIDDVEAAGAGLLASAMEDARGKAEDIARAEGRKVGRVVSVVEGYSSYPMPLRLDAKAVSETSAPVEPGTETLTKTVTVVYELK